MGDWLSREDLSRLRPAFWRAARRAAGSRQAMAEELGAAGFVVTDNAIGRWERGESDPGWEATTWSALSTT